MFKNSRAHGHEFINWKVSKKVSEKRYISVKFQSTKGNEKILKKEGRKRVKRNHVICKGIRIRFLTGNAGSWNM